MAQDEWLQLIDQAACAGWAELRQLASDVLVDYEDLPVETKSDLARELAEKCRRYWRLAEL